MISTFAYTSFWQPSARRVQLGSACSHLLLLSASNARARGKKFLNAFNNYSPSPPGCPRPGVNRTLNEQTISRASIFYLKASGSGRARFSQKSAAAAGHYSLACGRGSRLADTFTGTEQSGVQLKWAGVGGPEGGWVGLRAPARAGPEPVRFRPGPVRNGSGPGPAPARAGPAPVRFRPGPVRNRSGPRAAPAGCSCHHHP